jgi:protease I
MRVRRAVIITSSGFCDREVVYAYYRCLEEGWQVDVATPDGAPVMGRHGVPVPLDPEAKPNVSFSALAGEDYDAALLPGAPGLHPEPDPRVAAFLDAMTERGRVVAELSEDAWARRRNGADPESSADVVIDGTRVTCTAPAHVGRLMRVVFETTERRATTTTRRPAA